MESIYDNLRRQPMCVRARREGGGSAAIAGRLGYSRVIYCDIFLIVCLTFRSSDVCYIHRFPYTITSYQTNMQNTSKAIWIKLFSIADILSNTSFSLLDTKYMFNFGQSTIIQFFIECPKALPYMNDLLIVTGLSSSALSQTVDSLVDAGYLKRVYSEEYKNRVYVQATDSFMELRSKPLHFRGLP